MKHAKVSYWYIIVALLIVIAMLWFFIDLNRSSNPNQILKEAETAATTLNSTLNEVAIENIQKRKDISDELLSDIKTYGQNSAE